MDLFIVDDIIGPEGHVISGKGGAVRPFVPFTQTKDDLSIIGVPFPCFGDIGYDGLAIIANSNHIVLTPGKDLRGSRLVLSRKTTQSSAVFSDFIIGHHHKGFFRQSFLHRRQFAFFDFFGKHRISFECQFFAHLLFIVCQLKLLGKLRFNAFGIGNRRPQSCRRHRADYQR